MWFMDRYELFGTQNEIDSGTERKCLKTLIAMWICHDIQACGHFKSNLISYCIFTWWRGEIIFVMSLPIRTSIPFKRAPRIWPDHLPKTPLLITSHQGLGFQCMSSGKIQRFRTSFPLQWGTDYKTMNTKCVSRFS